MTHMSKDEIIELCNQSFDSGANAVFESMIETLDVLKSKFSVESLTIEQIKDIIQTAKTNINQKP
jgi:hypothetical protein